MWLPGCTQGEGSGRAWCGGQCGCFASGLGWGLLFPKTVAARAGSCREEAELCSHEPLCLPAVKL